MWCKVVGSERLSVVGPITHPEIQKHQLISVNQKTSTRYVQKSANKYPGTKASAIYYIIIICLLMGPGAKTINVFRACLGAQLTICAQK